MKHLELSLGNKNKKAKIQELSIIQVIVLDKLFICVYLDGKKIKQKFFQVLIPNKLGKVVRIVGDAELVGDAGYLPAK